MSYFQEQRVPNHWKSDVWGWFSQGLIVLVKVYTESVVLELWGFKDQ